MERYIRTKDGKIYDTERYAYTWSTPEMIGLGISVNESISIPKSLILRHTDTVEGLCDCIVYECPPKPGYDEYHRHEVGSVESLEWNRDPKRFASVRGSIWVDGNLMKIAEMNEKGELELL